MNAQITQHVVPQQKQHCLIREGMGKTWAVLIANSAYKYWDDLDKEPYRDIAAIQEALRPYAFDHILIKKDIPSSFDSFFSQLRENLKRNRVTSVLIYYAGHGEYDENLDRGYWIPVNAKNDSERLGYFPDNTLRDYISSFHVKAKLNHVLLIADCCFSGSVLQFRSGEEKPPSEADFENLKVDVSKVSSYGIASGRREERVPNRSLFSRALDDLLTRNRNTYLRTEDVAYHLSKKIREVVPHQKPQFSPLAAIHDFGQFVFIREPTQALPSRQAQPQESAARSPRTETETIFDKPVTKIPKKQLVTPKRKKAKNRVWVLLILIGFVIFYVVYLPTQGVDLESTLKNLFGNDSPNIVSQDDSLETQNGTKTVNQLSPVKSSKTDVNKKAKRPSQKYPLRSTHRTNLLSTEVESIVKKHGFYSTDKHSWAQKWSNPQGQGIPNEYHSQSSGSVVFDAATGLYWQQGGSLKSLTFAEAGAYINKINKEKHGGYSDWRLPTLEEAMSLMEPKRNNRDLYIDQIFDTKQNEIWTADKSPAGHVWFVSFDYGYCYFRAFSKDFFIRAVHSK